LTLIVGDLLDFDAVREALKGVNRAYFVYKGYKRRAALSGLRLLGDQDIEPANQPLLGNDSGGSSKASRERSSLTMAAK
jgi:hypothetical protein